MKWGPEKGSWRSKGGAEETWLTIPMAASRRPRTPSPSLGLVGKSGDARGEQGSRAVSWCFKNLSASHIKLKCK